MGRKLYELGNGQWDIPKLRTALETIISGQKTVEAFEVDQFFRINGPARDDAQRAQGLSA